MSSPHRSLAARFRTSVQKQREQEDLVATEQSKIIEQTLLAREELMDQLEEFAEAAEFFEVTRSEGGIMLKFDGRRIRFDLDRREPLILVRGSHIPQGCHISFHPTRRIWQVVFLSRHRRGRPTTVDLFPIGLERVISRGFGIIPATIAPPEPSALPGLEPRQKPERRSEPRSEPDGRPDPEQKLEESVSRFWR
jgi:hypothetical protein